MRQLIINCDLISQSTVYYQNNTKALNGPVPGPKTFQLMDEHAYCLIFHSTASTDDEDPLSKECE